MNQITKTYGMDTENYDEEETGCYSPGGIDMKAKECPFKSNWSTLVSMTMSPTSVENEDCHN